MSKTKIISMIGSLLFSIASFAQTGKKTETLKVSGNCDMCKSNIESALKKKDGVLSKSWNKDTKILSVTYDASKITIQKIGQKIADAGYDNQYATAKEETYNKLMKCCQYDRPKK